MSGFFKWVGIIAGILIALLAVIGGVFFITGKAKVTEARAVTPPLTMVEIDSASVARGAHLAQILSCKVCHGEDFEGTEFLDIPPFRAVATNLTAGAGGIANDYTDADWDRALRYGVKPNGQAMIVMPSNLFHNLSDADAAAMIAYMKSLPAKDNDLGETEFRAPLYLMAGAPGPNVFPNVIDEDEPRIAVPEIGPTAEYGAYLTRLACVECHGQDLRGGTYPEPDAPDGPDLAAAGQWQLAEFAKAMREGQTPYGTQLQDKYMPWEQSYQYLDDVEIEALHKHLATLGS